MSYDVESTDYSASDWNDSSGGGSEIDVPIARIRTADSIAAALRNK